ncbi:MAG: hypothetical protein HS129_04420 [Leptospiraceae bacterium]|nr:hypothetical protein [Leptospiraceae bacterium]
MYVFFDKNKFILNYRIHSDIKTVSETAKPNISIYKPWGNGNVYSYNSLFFSEIQENETWNLGNLTSYSPTFFSFLFMRAFLLLKIYGKNTRIDSLPQNIKNFIAKNCKNTNIPGIQFSEFIPRLVSKKNPSFFKVYFFKNSFFYYQKLNQSIFLAGGSLAKKSPSNKNFENIYHSILKKKNSGNLFFLQNNFSIFTEFLNKKPTKNLFFQNLEKKIDTDFLFWTSEIHRSD